MSWLVQYVGDRFLSVPLFCTIVVALTDTAISRFGQSVDRFINRALLTVRSADTPIVHRRFINNVLYWLLCSIAADYIANWF